MENKYLFFLRDMKNKYQLQTNQLFFYILVKCFLSGHLRTPVGGPFLDPADGQWYTFCCLQLIIRVFKFWMHLSETPKNTYQLLIKFRNS